ncbi:hypothetical protein PF003_g1288 [Phytophthora fragariae]|nr:hypothetical protein PF003_g1288 [Phytophthora fragariae]
MSPSPPPVRRAACVAESIGEVSLHAVASATNIESASWTSASTGASSSYYVEMSPSPPRVRRAACVATVMGGVSLHAVAGATNIESASWPSASTGTNSSYYVECHRRLPVSAVLLRRHRDGRSESPRRGERHQHRVRELDFRQHRRELVVLRRNVTVASPCPPCCLRRRRDGRSESPRRGERHQHRVRELDFHHQRANSSYRYQLSTSPPVLPPSY